MIDEAPVSSIDLVLDFDSSSMKAEDDAGPDTLRAPELSEYAPLPPCARSLLEN